MFSLGLIYSHGQGTKQNLGEAAKWYRQASEGGIGPAQYNLPLMHEDCRGIPQNRAEAIRLYRLVGAQGVEQARRALERLGASSETKASPKPFGLF